MKLTLEIQSVEQDWAHAYVTVSDNQPTEYFRNVRDGVVSWLSPGGWPPHEQIAESLEWLYTWTVSH